MVLNEKQTSGLTGLNFVKKNWQTEKQKQLWLLHISLKKFFYSFFGNYGATWNQKIANFLLIC